jgi:hypothetical protein
MIRILTFRTNNAIYSIDKRVSTCCFGLYPWLQWPLWVYMSIMNNDPKQVPRLLTQIFARQCLPRSVFNTGIGRCWGQVFWSAVSVQPSSPNPALTSQYNYPRRNGLFYHEPQTNSLKPEDGAAASSKPATAVTQAQPPKSCRTSTPFCKAYPPGLTCPSS